MLTDYLVRCPHSECGWYGSLFPKGDRAAFKPAVPSVREVEFVCPHCSSTWRARVVGDDVKPLSVADLSTSA